MIRCQEHMERFNIHSNEDLGVFRSRCSGGNAPVGVDVRKGVHLKGLEILHNSLEYLRLERRDWRECEEFFTAILEHAHLSSLELVNSDILQRWEYPLRVHHVIVGSRLAAHLIKLNLNSFDFTAKPVLLVGRALETTLTLRQVVFYHCKFGKYDETEPDVLSLLLIRADKWYRFEYLQLWLWRSSFTEKHVFLLARLVKAGSAHVLNITDRRTDAEEFWKHLAAASVRLNLLKAGNGITSRPYLKHVFGKRLVHV